SLAHDSPNQIEIDSENLAESLSCYAIDEQVDAAGFLGKVLNKGSQVLERLLRRNRSLVSLVQPSGIPYPVILVLDLEAEFRVLGGDTFGRTGGFGDITTGEHIDERALACASLPKHHEVWDDSGLGHVWR